MAWTLLRAQDEWSAYQSEAAKKFSVSVSQVQWGAGPQMYPCLVGSKLAPPEAGSFPIIYSAYVYPADAEELLKAAGIKLVDPDAPQLPTQKQCNRWVAAQLMAIVECMIEIGICGKPDVAEQNFENKLIKMLERVDQYHGEAKDKLRKQLASYESTLLDTLEPPG